MIEKIVLVFIVIVSAILGGAIYQNNPKSATNRSFVASAVAIIFWSIIMYLSVNTPDLTWTLFYIRLSMLAGTIMAIAFLLLAISFPQKTLPMKKGWLALLLFMGAITCGISMSPYMFSDLVVDGSNIEPTASWGIIFFMITSLGSNIATFIVLVTKFIRSKGREREQLRFIVFGTLTMFILLIVANFLIVILLKSSSFIFLGPLFTMIFLISVAYAVLRHKLLDIRLVVARAVSFTFLLTLVVLLEVGIFYLATQLLPATIDHTIIAFAGSILIVMSYTNLRHFITHITDHIFFQGRYDQEDLLKKLTSIMVSEMNVKLLEIKLIKALTSDMKVSRASFVLLSDLTAKPAVLSQKPAINPEIEELRPLVHKINSTLVFEELSDEVIKEVFRKLNISVIIPLKVADEEIGFFILGPKMSGDIYGDRDLELLEIFAPQAAIALKNADSYRQIQEFNQTLELKVIDRTHKLEEAQASELKLKDEFVFIATHDLATPVTAISGFTAMINARKESMSKSLKDDLQAITEASNRLKVLVNDLLQVARSDSGTIKVNLAEVDAKKLIEAAVRQITPLAQEKNVRINLKLDKENLIQADQTKFSEIVENLVSNGIKYNREHGELTISSRHSKGKVIFEFKDTGLGIDESEQSKVFTKFFRSETPEVRQRPGTGLGLFVVRMLVEKMGGKISFESQKDQGTTFWLEFNG